MHRLNASPERPPLAGMPGRDGLRDNSPVPGGEIPMSPTAKILKDIAGMLHLCLFIGLIFNILLAIWIFSDIRKRGEGSGIFVALALLAGAPAAIIYSLVRLGDRKV